MTGKAKLARRRFEKIGIISAMRLMAGGAARRLESRMLVRLGELVTFVTLKTQLIAVSFKEMIVIGPVRAMTGSAPPIQRGSMPKFLVNAEFLCVMALQAQLVARRLEQQHGHEAMPHVAFLAVLLFDAGVEVCQ